MDICRLDSLDQARSLVDCAYDVYGLTFHRSWLYEAEGLLEVNRRGDVTSLLAIEDGRVVGHLGLMRPSWDVLHEGAPISDPGLREVGLSIVHPDFRSRGVQALLGAAALPFLMAEGAHGAFMKCVTHHTRSQRGAMRFGGQPLSLSLGSVPRYIVYDSEQTDPQQPISTLGFYTRLRALPPARAFLPEGLDGVAGLAKAVGVQRGPGPAVHALGDSVIEMRWQGDRQLAQIYVLAVGGDLIDRLREGLRWLVGGHMAHVAVYLPTDHPSLVEMGPALQELGLFLSGWLPGFYKGGRDALILQAVAFSAIDPARVVVEGEAAQALRDAVLAGYQEARGRCLRLLETGRRGRVRVSVKTEAERATG